jgi:hypothetical protein
VKFSLSDGFHTPLQLPQLAFLTYAIACRKNIFPTTFPLIHTQKEATCSSFISLCPEIKNNTFFSNFTKGKICGKKSAQLIPHTKTAVFKGVNYHIVISDKKTIHT